MAQFVGWMNVLRNNVAQSTLPSCARSRPSLSRAQCSGDKTLADCWVDGDAVIGGRGTTNDRQRDAGPNTP